ncbi:PBP1A family penicillin-binding protein [Bacillus alkalicellulosilyticus]|uniref:PBP1A family penicillin-binding protein n=1 Tax=Alkalihalobacterium alkalicellulosilyticum TaxID=1912214 RepID=UPI0009982DFB|nr:PBP1A family penicillin-binding protein [Bacillus alkalicellulosilyticus]
MSDELKTRTGRRQARKSNEKNQKPSRKALFKKIALITGAFMAVAGIVGAIVLFSIIKDAPPLDPERLMFAQSAQVFDQNDENFSQLEAAENRIRISIHDIPQLMEDAVLSVEDVRFHQHFGIDIRRLFGAVAANLTGGFGAEGASTITQQVIKNAFLSPEKTISRKIQEQYLAIKLEQQYTKEQILEMYLNGIYFGKGAYGVQQASITYFNKENLEDLTVADAALLAGLPQRPSHFNPLNNPEGAERRRNIVIGLMERHGKITAAEAEEARSIAVVDQLNPAERDSYPFEAFLDQVLSEVEDIEGITPSDLYTAGLKIYTTLDQDAQSHVEAVLQTDEFITTYPENEDFQAGITLIDTKTGQIKAIGGGRQKQEVKRGFNYATDIKKQPGSTIKPILDYGPVIEDKKWSTGQIIVDEPHTYNDINNTPVRNFTRTHRGPVTMREALKDSLNVPAIKALQEVGTERAQEFAEGIGIPFDQPMTEAYGIGGFTTGISTLDLAGAYSAFGNDGIYFKPHTVRKIEFPDGRVIHTKPDPHVAMNDYTAYMITDMLKSAVREGTGGVANIPGLPMAGKTGTTNFATEDIERFNVPDGAVPDVWFAGYTTNYTAAVWTGYDRKGEGNYLLGSSDRQLAQQIFKAVISKVSEDKETEDFVRPNSVVSVKIEKKTGLLPSPFTPSSEIVEELFVRGYEPKQVSEKFNQVTAPQNLTAGYKEDSDQIIMSWSYPENQREGVSFRVQQSIGDEDFHTLDITKDMQFIINAPYPGTTYRFRVIAVSDENENLESDPAQVSVSTPEEEIEIPDPIEEDLPPVDETPPPPTDDEDLPIDIIPEPDDEEEPAPEGNRGRGNGNRGGTGASPDDDTDEEPTD